MRERHIYHYIQTLSHGLEIGGYIVIPFYFYKRRMAVVRVYDPRDMTRERISGDIPPERVPDAIRSQADVDLIVQAIYDTSLELIRDIEAYGKATDEAFSRIGGETHE